MEKERWADVPVWKRAVLEKREAQKYVCGYCLWLVPSSRLAKKEGVALSQYIAVRYISVLLEHTEAYVVKPRSLALVLTLVLSLL